MSVHKTVGTVARLILVGAFLMMPAKAEADGPDDDDPPLPCSDDDSFPYTGYRWKADPICVPGLVTIRSWFTPIPPYTYGAAVWYGQNVMEGTARYRNLDLTGFLDGVALMSPADTGRTVWLRRPGREWEGPYLVVDNANRSDIWPVIMHRGEVIEVGWTTAVRWGMVLGDGPIKYKLDGVEVYKGDKRPGPRSVEPLYYPDWWASMIEFENGREGRMLAQIKPDHEKFPGWIMRYGNYPDEWVFINTYDDWYEFWYPGDPRFDFDDPFSDKRPGRTEFYNERMGGLKQ